MQNIIRLILIALISISFGSLETRADSFGTAGGNQFRDADVHQGLVLPPAFRLGTEAGNQIDHFLPSHNCPAIPELRISDRYEDFPKYKTNQKIVYSDATIKYLMRPPVTYQKHSLEDRGVSPASNKYATYLHKNRHRNGQNPFASLAVLLLQVGIEALTD